MRLLLSILVLCGCAAPAAAQCLCGDMVFDITLEGYAVDTARYLFRKAEIDGGSRDTYGERLTGILRPPYAFEMPGGRLRLVQPTGGGLRSVTWEILDRRTGQMMRLTALHMHYDTPYEVGPIPFTAGTYVFDWEAIPAAALPEQKRLDGQPLRPGWGRLESLDLTLFHRYMPTRP